MTQQHIFGYGPVSCAAFNKDCTQVALSPNNSEVHIYESRGKSWEKIHELKEHGQCVTGIDWAPNSNRIVTCGADRNAYVWVLQDGSWRPTLVILRINRAATCVKWSPLENKFAVGSGSRLISVCYFEEENNWWVSKHIKKPIRSTITCLDWHPNNILLAAGSSDFKARVFSAYVKEVEKKPSPTSWGSKMPFGNLMSEFSNSPYGGGWVHSVCFSESGEKLCWVAHDSSLSVVDSGNGMAQSSTKTEFLPFLSCTWVTNNSMVVAGHGCLPMLYLHDDQGNITFLHKLDQSKSSSGGGTISAMKRFQTMDRMAATEVATTDPNTIHQNTITQVMVHSGTKDRCEKFVTIAMDGKMVIWDFKSLESSIEGLKLM
ncbi:actin-related protein 2/3 complex subunit 1A-B-like isoform X2 [Branchiostoma lanceolatum]|uniref:actin-related protein 2/3 complex subunit 1A-B-like isoform X2 n=1 Tax=Branchiostoma lanceolatum TaxID=7740 RepID=UPI00345568FC